MEDSITFPGPNFHVELAALDARHPVHYSRRLLIFRCSAIQREQQLRAFKIGVQALLRRCPILGGLVVPLPDDQARNGDDWRTIVPSQGLKLIVKDLRSQLRSFEELDKSNFAPAQLPYDLLVPVPQDLDNTRPFPACIIQYSAIEGGTIITFAMSHSVADGSGNNELFRILSEETRLAQQDANGSSTDDQPLPLADQVGMDRSFLRKMASDVSFNIEEHPGFIWTSTSVDLASNADAAKKLFAATAAEIPVLLRMSPASLAQLKADATPSESDVPFISTHDALSALVWRSLLRIRSQRSLRAGQSQDVLNSTPGQFFMPSDARRALDLPASYVGNVVYQLTASLDLGTLLAPNGLRSAAGAIRQSITGVSPALVKSYVAQTREKWVNWRFLTAFSTTGVAMGTDWTSDMLYRDDWGGQFGPLIRYRYPDEPVNCIMPKLADGGAEIYVSVMPDEVEMLWGRDCFGRYLE